TRDGEALSRCAAQQRRALVEFADQVRAWLGPELPLEVLELAPLQAGVLADCLASADRSLYVSQTTLALAGRLEPERMRQAWIAVVERHTALRTALAWDGRPRPIQIVHRTVE